MPCLSLQQPVINININITDPLSATIDQRHIKRLLFMWTYKGSKIVFQEKLVGTDS